MRYLVTGAAGFIGSHIVDRLISDGHEVVAMDNESAECNSRFYWNDQAEKVTTDISRYNDIEKYFENVDCVFHLAAEARIQPAILNPVKAAQVNVVGTCNVLQASRTHGVDRVIYSSTSSSYGFNEPPLTEDMPNDCLNPYSVTKVCGEELCKMYHKLFGLKTIILRYFNVYGERQPLQGQYAPVVGIFQRQISSGEPMTIVGDGSQRRDFTHVCDVSEANILAANSNNEEIFGEIFNVGTRKNHSILELALMIGKDFIHIPERPGEAKVTLANIDKIKDMLGWEPQISLQDWLEVD